MLSAQNDIAVDSLFYRSVAMYRDGRYVEALKTMELMDREYPGHHRMTASMLMRAKSRYKVGEYSQALALFEKLIKDFPESQYADDGLYGMASAYYCLNEYGKAVQRFLDVVERGDDRRLMRKAALLSSEIMDSLMDEKKLKGLLKDVSGEKGKAAVTLRLAEKEIENGRSDAAKGALNDFLKEYPKSPYASQIEHALQRAEQGRVSVLKVGVVVPLSGPLAEQGQALLSGIQYAIDVYNENAGVKVELVVRNTEGSIVRAIRAAQEICEDEEVVAIIGELQSEVTAAMGAVAQEKGVVLLAPTTTLDDITSIGSFVFQVNSSLKVRGEALAEYAVTGLGLKRFAVLYPADAHGQSMRDSFVSAVNRMGGEILVEKWYFEGTQDLSPQFKAIREAGIKKMIADSSLVIVSAREYTTRYADKAQRGGTQYVRKSFSGLVDSTGIAVTSIDGLFLPVRSEDLPYVVTQPAFFNLKTKLFGGNDWNAIDVLKEQQKYIADEYIDGVIFLSDYYIDPSNFQYYRFRDEYRQKMGSTPEKIETFGYDTAMLLFNVVDGMGLSRQQVRDRLAETTHFQGIHGTVSFDENRVNRSLYLLQYRGGNVIRMK